MRSVHTSIVSVGSSLRLSRSFVGASVGAFVGAVGASVGVSVGASTVGASVGVAVGGLGSTGVSGHSVSVVSAASRLLLSPLGLTTLARCDALFMMCDG